jgi:hypothetical protein
MTEVTASDFSIRTALLRGYVRDHGYDHARVDSYNRLLISGFSWMPDSMGVSVAKDRGNAGATGLQNAFKFLPRFFVENIDRKAIIVRTNVI